VKTHTLKTFALFACATLCWGVIQAAGKDYSYFVTENEGGFSTDTNGNRFISDATAEKAKRTKECQPSSADPEGNWGATNDGLQLSVRFEKSEFTNNEPIVAMFLVRNVGDQWRAVDKHLGYASDFIIIGPDGRSLERHDWPPANTPMGQALRREDLDVRPDSVDAGMQYKRKIDLKKYYDFSAPGKYTVSLKLGGFLDFPKPEKENVLSGNAVITVTNSPPAITNALGK
jgi:hypothetical protein